jgi:hypothetical protein
MDDALISGKQHLFALCITDGALYDTDDERRTAMILEITEFKESLLKDYLPADSDRKNTSKVSK